MNTTVIRIGREPDNDFVVNLPIVSGYHARVLWEGEPGRAVIEDLGSSNGTALGSPEHKITRSALTAADTIYLGSYAVPAAQVLARLHPSLVPSLVFRGDTLLIGRNPDCDCVVDLPIVSGRHARLVRKPDSLVIEDLGSSNGTFVNGLRIDTPTPVKDRDVVGLGRHVLVLVDESRQVARGAPAPLARELRTSAAGAVGASSSANLSQELARILEQPWRLAALLAQAPLLALLLVAMLGAKSPEPASPESLNAASRSVGALLLGVSLAAIWFGLSDAVFGNLLAPPRMGSRLARVGARGLIAPLCLLLVLGALQCLLAWAVLALIAGLKAPSLAAVALLALASAVGLALGCVVVLLAPRPEVTWVAVVLLMLLSWGFAGGTPAFSNMPSWAQTISGALPARWAFEGLLLLESDRYPAVEVITESEPPQGQDIAESYFAADSDRMGTMADAVALGSMLIGLVAMAAFISESSRDRS
jgi:pSer/pThr/pTyr-binding forkhead associated (FHA) protein